MRLGHRTLIRKKFHCLQDYNSDDDVQLQSHALTSAVQLSLTLLSWQMQKQLLHLEWILDITIIICLLTRFASSLQPWSHYMECWIYKSTLRQENSKRYLLININTVCKLKKQQTGNYRCIQEIEYRASTVNDQQLLITGNAKSNS